MIQRLIDIYKAVADYSIHYQIEVMQPINTEGRKMTKLLDSAKTSGFNVVDDKIYANCEHNINQELAKFASLQVPNCIFDCYSVYEWIRDNKGVKYDVLMISNVLDAVNELHKIDNKLIIK